MGWSCSALASKVTDLWTAMCVEMTGSSNVYTLGGVTFMYEISNREHDDGAITGTILRFLPNMPDGTVDTSKPGNAVKASSFKIAGDGSVKRGPMFLKNLALEAASLTDIECRRRCWDAKRAS